MTAAADTLAPVVPAQKTIRLATRSLAVKQAMRRAFSADGRAVNLEFASDAASARPGRAGADVLVLDLAAEPEGTPQPAPVVVRLVPREKWFSLSRSERHPGRVFRRPDDGDAAALDEMAGAVASALRPYRTRRARNAERAEAATRAAAGAGAGAGETRASSPRESAKSQPTKTERTERTERREPVHRVPSPSPSPGASPAPGGSAAPAARPVRGATPAAERVPKPSRGGTAEARRAGRFQPRLIVVASSTGGPQALMTMFRALRRPLDVPVLVVQHMPATFTPMLAEHIASATAWPCREAKDDEIAPPNEVRIAPGGYHLEVVESSAGIRVKLNTGPLVNFCRPAADVLFHSAAKLHGRHTLAVVLTGMGSDGALGAEAIHNAGGIVIAQDEETSVVWGMPGATVRTGAAEKVLPLAEIAPAISFAAKGVT